MTETTTADVIRTLHGENYISLETYRKDGSGVPTPVWFAELGDRLVIFTNGTSYKVKRLRRNTDCRVAPCTARGKVTGEWVEGTCVIVEDAAAERDAYAALNKKYGIQMKALSFGAKLSGRIKQWTVLHVTFPREA